MTLKELKKEILENTFGDDLLILVCQDDTFLAETYIDAICEKKSLAKRYTQTLAETVESALALVMDFSSDLSIVKTETFSERSDDYSEYKNCVVICKKLDKSVMKNVEPFVVQIPRTLDWQAEDYVCVKCPGLSEKDAAWLWEAAEGSVSRIDNALNLLLLVDEKARSGALHSVCSDMFAKKQVYDLVDALIRQDSEAAAAFVRHSDDYTNLDPVGLTTLTLSKFRNIALLCYRSGVKEADLGLSNGAIWHIKNDNRAVSMTYIQKAIDFLSEIDLKLKANPCGLDFVGNRKNAFFEYVVTGVLACGR